MLKLLLIKTPSWDLSALTTHKLRWHIGGIGFIISASGVRCRGHTFKNFGFLCLINFGQLRRSSVACRAQFCRTCSDEGYYRYSSYKSSSAQHIIRAKQILVAANTASVWEPHHGVHILITMIFFSSSSR